MHSLTVDRSPPHADDVEIAVVGGGSRGWAPTLMNDLALTTAFEGRVRLYDLDTDSAARNAELGTHVQSLPDAVGDWTYEVAEELREAVDGADFVVCSTQDPPAETFKHDLDLPKAHGIYQTVGDTVGPGGAFRTLRSVPQYREIAAAVRDHAPEAWVFNFTNPMSTITKTLYEEYPEVNAIGLCHEVFGTQGWLAGLVERHLDAEVHRDAVDVTVTGINHFTWVTRARWRGTDLFELVDRELTRQSPLPAFEPGAMREESIYVDNHHVTLDLYDRFEALPAAGDRHLAEFVPWYLNVDDPEDADDPAAIHRWGIRSTPSSERTSSWPDGESWREAILSGESSFSLEASGEEMVDIMAALLGGDPIKTNLNLPNRGQAPGLREGAVVETNALVTGDKVEPLVADPLPAGAEALVNARIDTQETLVQAGFSGDLDLAFQAFLTDPLVGTVDRETAEELFRELVHHERSYLEAYGLDAADILA